MKKPLLLSTIVICLIIGFNTRIGIEYNGTADFVAIKFFDTFGCAYIKAQLFKLHREQIACFNNGVRTTIWDSKR